MRKSILFLSVVLLSGFAHGQRNFWKVTKGTFYWSNSVGYEYDQLKNEKEFLKENLVKSRVKTNYHNNKPLIEIQSFNDEGSVVSINRNGKNFKLLKNFTYDENNNPIKINTVYNYGKKVRKKEVTLSYNKDNKLIKRESIDKKGNYHGYLVGYNESGEVALKQIFDKDKENPKYELEYSYYPDGSKQQDIYKKKGKVKYIWNYDCKPEGELLNVKNKDNSTICIKEETDTEGNRVVWKREFSDKGKLVKTKTVFSPDTTLLSIVTFNQQDHLLSESKYKENGDFKTVYYDKKEKEKSTYSLLYNGDKQMRKIVRTGKWNFTYLYNYEEKLKVTEVRLHKRSTYVSEFEYGFF